MYSGGTGSGLAQGSLRRCDSPAALLLLSTATPLAVANLPTRATSSTPGLCALSAPGAAPGSGGRTGGSPRRLGPPRPPRSLPRRPVRSSRAPRRACPSAGTRGAGGRALAGGGPAGPRASPGTRPCHSHDAQPPGTASGARPPPPPPPPPPPLVGGGRDGLRGGVAPPLAAPAPPSPPALPTAHGAPGSPAGVRGGCGRQTEEGGARVSAFPRAPGRAPPGTRGARRAAGPGSPCRPRRAGSGSGQWLGLDAAMGQGRGPREAPPARAWRLLRPAFLESQRVQVGPR